MKKSRKIFINNLITYGIVVLAFIVCQLAVSGSIDGFKMSRSLKGQLIPICAWVVMAVSLNLTVGISGELSARSRASLCPPGWSVRSSLKTRPCA